MIILFLLDNTHTHTHMGAGASTGEFGLDKNPLKNPDAISLKNNADINVKNNNYEEAEIQLFKSS